MSTANTTVLSVATTNRGGSSYSVGPMSAIREVEVTLRNSAAVLVSVSKDATNIPGAGTGVKLSVDVARVVRLDPGDVLWIVNTDGANNATVEIVEQPPAVDPTLAPLLNALIAACQ